MGLATCATPNRGCRCPTEHQLLHGAVSAQARTVIVVVGYVVIPQWTEKKAWVVLLLVEIGTEEAIYIGTDFSTQIPSYERERIYQRPVARSGIGKVVAE